MRKDVNASRDIAKEARKEARRKPKTAPATSTATKPLPERRQRAQQFLKDALADGPKPVDPAGKLKLNRFDAFVRALHSYEEIRYPEKMVRDGMGSYFQFGKRTTRVKASGRGANVPKYQLFVADADAMVKAICDASSINAKAFTSKYQQEPGKTFLRHENAETGLFQ